MLVSGHTVSPFVFWSLVDAAYLPEDHEKALPQKMILTCLSYVHQRPENYQAFLLDNSIKMSASLKRGFQRAQQKRTRKGGPKKSHLGGGSSLNRLTGVMEGGAHHGGGPDDHLGSGLASGGSKFGAGVSTEDLSEGGGSDDMSDTMSVFSVSTQLEAS